MLTPTEVEQVKQNLLDREVRVWRTLIKEAMLAGRFRACESPVISDYALNIIKKELEEKGWFVDVSIGPCGYSDSRGTYIEWSDKPIENRFSFGRMMYEFFDKIGFT